MRCGGRLRVALGAADLLARCPGFALVVLDLDDLGPVPASAYIRLQRAVEGTDTILIVRAARHREGSPASLVLTTRRLAPQWIGRAAAHPPGRPALRGLHLPLPLLHSLSPLRRGQGEGLKAEGLKGEGLKGEGRWTLDWTLSQ